MKCFPVIIVMLFSINLIGQIDHWETIIYAEDEWSYELGSPSITGNWNQLSFDDSNWNLGSGSIGYGDGDDNTNIPNTVSLFMRKKFTIVDKSKIDLLIFNADYDDGFVAYLNGVEIARSNVNGMPNYDTEASGLHEAALYQGGTPEIYYLNGIDLQQLLIDGTNLLAVSTHNYDGTSSSDLTSAYWLSGGINDMSSDYGQTPTWFESFIFESPLPIVKVNTWGEEIPDEPYVQAEIGIIWNGPGNLNSSQGFPNEYFGNITIEIRGQSSQSFPKKNYAVETKDADWVDMDASFLNFPAEEDWILHGPYSDKTLIRNVLAMELATNMGQYASRTRLVELLINEEYVGVYVLMEKIKRDQNRVDIATLNPDDISGDELTGGYVIKVDKGDADWVSNYDMMGLPGEKLSFQFVSPNRNIIEPEQEAYIESYVDSFENSVVMPEIPFGGKYYYEYIDLTSFAEHFLFTELTKNVDGYRISSYLYKDKDSNGGLLNAGPVWDYNLGFGNADYCDGDSEVGWIFNGPCSPSNPFWWENLRNDVIFQNAVKCRWEELRTGPFSLDSIFNFIDEKALMLEPVVDRNFQRWPILDQYIWPNPEVTGSYQGEINYMKSEIESRIAWMDIFIFGECIISEVEDVNPENEFVIYPNPFSTELQINYSGIQGALNYQLFNTNGTVLVKGVFENETTIDTKSLPPGIYFVSIYSEENIIYQERIVNVK